MIKRISLFALLAMIVAACSTIDCSLNSRVAATYKLDGTVKKLATPLTVSADLGDNKDTILLNQLANTDSFMLPMSYNRKQDVLYFKTVIGTSTLTDKVTITKEDHPHFEAVDCTPMIFHNIISVEYTRNFIDSIVINNKNVTNGTAKSNFLLYFKSTVN